MSLDDLITFDNPVRILDAFDGGYKIRNQTAIHLTTFAVVEWIDVFTRKDYRDIILESLEHCQTEKGLLLHC